jgi:hypothetical protein
MKRDSAPLEHPPQQILSFFIKGGFTHPKNTLAVIFFYLALGGLRLNNQGLTEGR